MPRRPSASARCRHRCLALLSGVGLLWALLAVSQAQISLDGSLGPRGPLSGPHYRIDANMGQTRGGNLFHSFGEFNVPTGGSATFTGPATISNILSRVTGGQPSAIDGVLRSEIAGANLYLLNPSGVLFGPHASLAVSGSFHVSTADFLRFTDRATFSADLGHESVLTMAAPAAFGFLGNTPASITMQGSTLQVPTGRALSVVGGDIQIVGGRLQALSGRVQLASVAAPGEVGFSPLELAPDLRVDSFARLGRIGLSQGALLSTSGDGGGTVLLRSGRLLVDRSSIVVDNTGPADGTGLGVDLRVAADAVLTSGLISSSSDGGGNAGNITVQVGTLHMLDSDIGAGIGGSAMGGGLGHHGGNIEVTATDSITISSVGTSLSGISSNSASYGDAGHVAILAPALIMDGGGIDTLGVGAGRSGDIDVAVGRLMLTGGALINSSTFGSGRGGNLTITAQDSILIAGRADPRAGRGNLRPYESGVFSLTAGVGQAGRISVTTPQVIINDGGQIAADTSGAGRGGDIQLHVGTLAVTGGAQVASRSGVPRLGDAIGSLADPPQGGRSGSVTISATDVVSIAGQNSGLFSDTRSSGLGGEITLQAREIRLTEGASISATSSGTGDAGRLTLTATERFRSNHSTVTTAATAASGGDITLTAGSRIELRESQLTASVRGGPQTVGGNLTIGAPLIISDGSQIRATAVAGRGGTIGIGAQVFLADPASLVSASSDLGISGTVDIRAPVTTLSGTLAPLPQAFVNVAELLPARCAARFSGGKASSLVLGGRGGLPLEPGGVLPSPLAIEERLAADPAVTGGPPHAPSPARFAFLTAQEKAFSRLPGHPLARGCPKG